MLIEYIKFEIIYHNLLFMKVPKTYNLIGFKGIELSTYFT